MPTHHVAAALVHPIAANHVNDHQALAHLVDQSDHDVAEQVDHDADVVHMERVTKKPKKAQPKGKHAAPAKHKPKAKPAKGHGGGHAGGGNLGGGSLGGGNLGGGNLGGGNPVQSQSLGVFAVGGFTLNNVQMTSTGAGQTLAGDINLPVVGPVHFTGTYANAAQFDLTATTGPTATLGGLVQFSGVGLELKPESLAMAGNATVGSIGQASFFGQINADMTYRLHADASVTVAGFTLKGASLDLGSDSLAVDTQVPVPSIGDVEFRGSYGPGDAWSLGATIPGPIDVGGFPMYDLQFGLTNTSLMLGAKVGLADVADVGVKGTVSNDGTYTLTADVNTLPQTGGFQVADANVTLTNANPDRVLTATIDATEQIPDGPSVHLSGTADGTGYYKLTGTGDLNFDDLSLAQASFTLEKGQGLSLNATLNYGVLTAQIGGGIDPDGHAHFVGGASGQIDGFDLGQLTTTVDLDPTTDHYAVDLTGEMDSGLTLVGVTGHAGRTGGVWDPITLSGQASVNIAGLLTGAASFSFTNGAATLAGSLDVRNAGIALNVTANIYADGTLDLGGLHINPSNLSLGDAVRLLYNEGVKLGPIAEAVWGKLTGNLGSLCGALSSVDGNLGDVVSALSGVVNNVGSVASAIWHNWNGASIYLADLASGLWNHWGGSSGFDLGDLASALSSIDGNLADVVSALSDVVNDAGSVASAVWHHWAGGSSFSAGSLVGALESIFGLNPYNAWRIVNAL